jgi:hypothetical protein
MQINMNNINSNVEEDLKYFKNRAEEQEQMKILERKRQERDDRSKLSLKNANEFLFIPEEIEIEISYGTEENKEISVTLLLQEMNLYDLFKYLTDKKYESIDFLLEKHCGDRYSKIKNELPEEQKLQIIEQIEELSNIREMFSSGSEEELETEEEKKIKEKMEKANTMADCIKAFGGTITYLCETWGKMPVEVLKGLTYRQFKWYLDIIVAKQKELDKMYNKKNEGESWSNQKEIGNDGVKYGDYERTPSIAEQIAQGKYGNKDSKNIYDNGSIIPGRIAKDGEIKASESGGNVLLDINRSNLEREGYKIVEDYEGAVVLNKKFKIPEWKMGEFFDM